MTLLNSYPSFPTQHIFPLWINISIISSPTVGSTHGESLPQDHFPLHVSQPSYLLTFPPYVFLIGIDMYDKALWPFGCWFSPVHLYGMLVKCWLDTSASPFSSLYHFVSISLLPTIVSYFSPRSKSRYCYSLVLLCFIPVTKT